MSIIDSYQSISWDSDMIYLTCPLQPPPHFIQQRCDVFA